MIRHHALSLALAALAAVPVQAPPVTFNAIAVDVDVAGARGDGSYGLGQGPTARIAMSNCRLGGHVACEVKITFRQCAAYAASRMTSGTGTGTSIPDAAERARAACGDAACQLVVADCVASSLLPQR